MKIERYFVVFFLGVYVLFFSGCALTGGERSSRRDSRGADSSSMSQIDPGEDRPNAEYDKMADILKFEDIPIPAGFALEMKDSFIFRNDALRVGIVKYIGRGDISVVTSFFKRQMPLFNWELINSIEYYKSILTLRKDSQACVIIVETIGNRVEITIASCPNTKG